MIQSIKHKCPHISIENPSFPSNHSSHSWWGVNWPFMTVILWRIGMESLMMINFLVAIILIISRIILIYSLCYDSKHQHFWKIYLNCWRYILGAYKGKLMVLYFMFLKSVTTEDWLIWIWWGAFWKKKILCVTSHTHNITLLAEFRMVKSTTVKKYI